MPHRWTISRGVLGKGRFSRFQDFFDPDASPVPLLWRQCGGSVCGPPGRRTADSGAEKPLAANEEGGEEAVEHKIADQDASWLDWLEIGALDASEIEEVLDVLARSVRDNPLPVAAFGEDPTDRRRRVRALMAAALCVRDFSHTLVARRQDGPIVGVCAMLPPGECLPELGQRLRMLPTLVPIGPSAAERAMRWMGLCQKHDPKERHWHLGPVAVEAHLQGMGVGGRLMGVFCAKMDAAHEDAYLETDEAANVSFFERFGFEVVGEQEVLDVINYFMLRRKRGTGSEARRVAGVNH